MTGSCWKAGIESIDIIRTVFPNLFGRFLHDILKDVVGYIETKYFNHHP
ncbi:MAG: hypothetical protein OZ917_04685 [Candidatus Brocadiaceae bacterium]|nr:hypothetical protein [Candidatus Brocadiaceae bacterium]